MDLWKKLLNIYPNLTDDDFHPNKGTILLQDDSDGEGSYIAKWEHELPLPEGFKIGK